MEEAFRNQAMDYYFRSDNSQWLLNGTSMLFYCLLEIRGSNEVSIQYHVGINNIVMREQKFRGETREVIENQGYILPSLLILSCFGFWPVYFLKSLIKCD
jgi:hypothetical protein